jgi:TonB family protein
MGQTKGDERAKVKSDDPAAGAKQEKLGAAGPQAGQTEATKDPSDAGQTKPDQAERKDSTAPEQEAPKETRDQVAAAGAMPPPPPKPTPSSDALKGKAPQPTPHTTLRLGGNLEPNLRPEAPPHAENKAAKVPGPNATQDEYLVYVKDLIESRILALPPTAFPNRPGVVMIEIRLRRNGVIVWTSVRQPSGYPAFDEIARRTIDAIGRFAPVPQRMGGGDTIPLIGRVPLTNQPNE